MNIAEAAAAAWHSAHGADHPEIPVSVVAALAMITPPAGELDTVSARLLSLDPHQLTALIRGHWAIFITARLDLLNRAWPLIKPWYDDQRPSTG